MLYKGIRLPIKEIIPIALKKCFFYYAPSYTKFEGYVYLEKI